ncbi:Protein angel 2 [Mortierella claussenii]|nr:Protein angel 2 [Mortierella claussenii]
MQIRDNTFTIMTYNLLADSLVQSNRHLYRKCDKQLLRWPLRRKILIRELSALESHKLDFYCFQELDKHHYDNEFKNKFEKWGYEGVFKKRNGQKQDGCALFFRTERVRKVQVQTVDYQDNAYINRDNVGIVGVFEIKQGAEWRKVCIATTHILFNPRSGMLKLAQLRMLLEEAKRLMDLQEQKIPIASANISDVPEEYLSGQTPGHPRTHHIDHNGIKKFMAAFEDTYDSAAIHPKESQTLMASSSRAQNTRFETEFESRAKNETICATLHMHPARALWGVTDSDTSKKHDGRIEISQPFHLKSAYNIEAPSRMPNGSVDVPPGAPFTTFHGLARLTCDYILYGHLRAHDGAPDRAPDRLSDHANNDHDNKNDNKDKPNLSEKKDWSKLALAGTLKLPCELLEGSASMPVDLFGSDHLSLVSQFMFQQG